MLKRLSKEMDDKALRVAYLVAGFINDTVTDAESRELDDWVSANMENQQMFERLLETGKRLKEVSQINFFK